MVTKARTSLTSLERLERQILAISGDRAQGDAWEKALKGWINAGGHPELTEAWSKGGATSSENCQMLCKSHNRAKGNK
jgi:hypothetical protein